ncbi:MAG: hypothetical protein HZA90_27245 [Verrucomicrobia bacterium]|nr:hypothetical protein [Verrucomicrobiota bacterium]
MKHSLRVILAALVLAASAVRADGPEDQYVQIYSLIQEADALNDAGQKREALARYAEAQAALAKFPTAFPGWSEKVVSFRLNYIASKLSPLVAQYGTNVATAAAVLAPGPAGPAVPGAETNTALRELQQELQRLQAENANLSAKLKEALSVQPSVVDPRELAKAEEKNKALQKENELLKVTLGQEQEKSTKLVDPAVLAEARQSLAGMRGRLDEQDRTLAVLKQENDLLKKQAAEAEKKGGGATPPSSQQLQQTRDSLAALQAANDKLRAEKAVVEAQLADLSRQLARPKEPAGSKDTEQLLAKLQQENAALQKEKTELQARVASLPTVPADPAKTESKKVRQLKDELDKQSAAAKAAAKQSEEQRRQIERDRSAWLKERAELESRLVASAADATKAEIKKRKQLESELEDVRGKLEKAQKQLSKKPSNKSDLEQQVEVLQARLQILEAKPLPYTTEELAALDKKPVVQLAASTGDARTVSPARDASPEAKHVKRTVKELPPGTGDLASAAQRAFLARRYDEAEQKYLDILRQDEKNVFTLGNVAAIQVEMSKLDAAEKNLGTALALDAQDDFCLYLMGRVKFLRGKLDEALDLLSQSAKANPDSAETQNYLGIVLSEKGLRPQAETAFRKAIQLQPRYAAAHNNLAFIYATQKPPSTALARWHYQKALDAGHPKNPDLEKFLGDTK